VKYAKGSQALGFTNRDQSGIQCVTPFTISLRDTMPPTKAFWSTLAGEKADAAYRTAVEVTRFSKKLQQKA
jgi:hypothetical protein